MRRNALLAVFLVAMVHLGLTVLALVGSLYFTWPGEPNFDPGAAQRAADVGKLLGVLAFPIIPLFTTPLLRPLAAGQLGWIWFAANSLLWGCAMVLGWQAVAGRLRLVRRRSGDGAQ